jgi:regulator of extracellular matrix RemA (YlzA/DUF370 family)
MSNKKKIIGAGQGLHIGFGHAVMLGRIIAVLEPGAAPLIRLRHRAQEEGRLVDAAKGRKVRAIIIMDSNHVVLSAVSPETLWSRAKGADEGPEDELSGGKDGQGPDGS